MAAEPDRVVALPEAAIPSWSEVYQRISQWATDHEGEWCGFPAVLPGLGLQLETRSPWRERVDGIRQILEHDETPPPVEAIDPRDEGAVEINSWHSDKHRGTVIVARRTDGTVTWGIVPDAPARNRFAFGPFDTLDAWSLDAELRAMQSLAGLLPSRMFKAYVCTGAFLETSPRSQVTYWFRRCRPTVAIVSGTRDQPTSTEMRLLCALCCHPIGFYSNSFSGAMTPTDDVIAHLIMMRADERRFWARCNQHPAWSVMAGL